MIRNKFNRYIVLTSLWFGCRYDPSRYAGRDDDDSDMEADFATIEMEEKRRYLCFYLMHAFLIDLYYVLFQGCGSCKQIEFF